jgi:hypothetical protein
MWPVLLMFLVFVVLITLTVFLVNKWLSAYLERHIRGRLDAIDQIVNDEQVPEAWIGPYRERAAKLRASGGTDEQIADVALRARKRCLLNIQELIRYVQDVGLSDSEATKRYMLEELRRQEAAWQDDATWYEVVNR